MPSVPQPSSAKRATHFAPPDPNLAHDLSAHIPPSEPSPQPAPSVSQSLSHVDAHFPPRRFLGQIPENVVNSTEVQEKRRRLSDLRKRAIAHLPLHNHGEGSTIDLNGDVDSGLIRGAARRIRVIRRGLHGEDVREELDLDVDLEDDYGAGGKKKKKQKRKDVWVGESFDIGREFLGRTEEQGPEDTPPTSASSSSPTASRPQRPPVSTRTTQDTFVTARTEISAAASSSTSNLGEEEAYDFGHPTSPSINGPSTPPQPPNTSIRVSQSSSLQPLITSLLEGEGSEDDLTSRPSVPDQPSSKGKGQIKSPGSGISHRLKSALRHTSRPNLKSTQSALVPLTSQDGEGQAPPSAVPVAEQRGFQSKSVQFPVDPVQHPHPDSEVGPLEPTELRRRKGNKAPVDPHDVLSREGDEAVGTSAGAVEDAMEEQEGDGEEDRKPGEVIMRDRTLVRIGYHREDQLSIFDEAAQRRNPCSRLDPFEEYIIVWRKGQIELYQDYKYPLQERVIGHKHLCFVVPLLPNRTSLTIFNAQDNSICLTTSVGKLQDDVSHLMRSNTSRAGALKNRVKDSRQVQWLRGRRRGTQVFIMKMGQKSRSLDWYWELWRELGGELPERFDVIVPSLTTSIRLLIPQDEEDYMVGSAAQCRAFNKDRVIQTCWEMLQSSIDVDDLKRQSEQQANGDKLRMELAWKSDDGNLDWVAYGTTVHQKVRGWALLAGLARTQGETIHRDLQLRPARHQPKALKLEDGSWLEEPPSVEGYLIRHKKGAKERVYVTSHDGNIFVGSMNKAHPPIIPGKEGSTPSDLFQEVYRSFVNSEHRRMARFLERCAGCIDLRDIVNVRLVRSDVKSKGRSNSVVSARPQHSESGTGNGDNRALQQSDVAEADDSGAGRLGHGTETDDTRSPTTQHENGDDGSTMFEVIIGSGGDVQLEACSAEVAREWVDRLKSLMGYWKRRHRVDARQRMDVRTTHSQQDAFSGTSLCNTSDSVLSEIWDFCAIEGCRSICISGRLFMQKEKRDKFRQKYIVLTGGSLITFKMKRKDAFHIRKKRYPLFGAYVYSGMLALDELPANISEQGLVSHARVYQDGLQSSDGEEDTTFVVRLAPPPTSWGKNVHPWEMDEEEDEGGEFVPSAMGKKGGMLIFRARSKLERDRWVWAINAEMERQVRAHTRAQSALREHGVVPDRWS